jgi:glucoamylase
VISSGEPGAAASLRDTADTWNASVGRTAVHIVSHDALALLRFGLRAADDSRIVDAVAVIDSLLTVETPSGTAWHRYNVDPN